MSARILIIEDNRPNLDLMVYLLNAFGYETVEAINGTQGLEAVREHRLDLIVCDIQLPGMDGYELVRLFKDDPSLDGVPVIAVSALAMVGDRERILSTGFDGYIAKPITPTEFVQSLEHYLPAEQRSLGRSNQDFDTETPATVATSERRGVILAVDDRKSNLRVIESLLVPFGFQVLIAESGVEAFKVLEEHTPDLILSDMHLADEVDFHFIQQIKDDLRYRSIPFVFISSTTKKESVRQEGIRNGAARFIFRPIEPQALLDEINECLLTAGRG